MNAKLDPIEQRLFDAARRSGVQSCTHCHFMEIQAGPASAPFAEASPDAVASLFCRYSPRVVVPTSTGLLGVHPPVRPNDWCGQFTEQRSKLLSEMGS